MKHYKKLLFASMCFISLPFLAGCSNGDEGTTIRVLNLEDYIYLYEGDPETDEDTPEEDKMDLIDQFARDMEDKYPEMGKINVVYTTTDTNETMYNELKTGKAVYDLVCTSDYMIQKLIIDNLIEPVNKALVPNYYDSSVSDVVPYIKEQFGQITAKNFTTQNIEKVDDYSVGYMWGTLGILYNPEFEGFSDEALENIHDDVSDWGMLWDETYKGSISIKNSMRDTYAVGILRAYQDELEEYKNHHTLEEYTSFLGKIFNSFEQKDVDAVKDQLNALKKNIFGLEVDSGKLDIVTGKIGINIAWSGDAVYSMELAEGYDKEIYYAIPELGSNVWFDGWCIPKRPDNQARTNNETLLTHEFLNYLCSNHAVKENMDYTGYTSFVGGEEVRDLMRDWYDARTDFMYYYDEENDAYYDVFYELEGDEITLEYEDFEESEHEHNNDALPLYYYQPVYDEEGNLLEDAEPTKERFNDPLNEEEDVPLTFGDILIEKLLEHEDVQVVDLQYAFGDNQYDYRFYSYLYLPFEDNMSAGLDFFCQYPNEETLKRCAVMAFDPENNDRVVKMWEDFKSDSLPVWAIVLFAVELVSIGGLVLYVTLNKRIKKEIRKRRLAQEQ